MHPARVQQQPRGRLGTRLLLVLVGTCVLLPALDVRGFWSAAEGRAPLIGRDIAATGRVQPPWFAGAPYLNKPPLYHTFVAASFRLSGREDELSARLPAVLCALIALLLTESLAREMLDPRAGWCAALALLASHRFFSMARSAELEILLTAAVAATCLGVQRGWRRGGYSGVLLALGGAAVATLTKGPVLACLFPALYLLALLASERSLRPLRTKAALGALLGLVIATLAYYGPLLLDASHREALLARATFGNVRHARGPLYYLYKLPLGLLPALLFVLACLPAMLGNWRKVRVPLLAASAALVVFSCSASKQTHYLLPAFPWIAVVAGGVLSQAVEQGLRRRCGALVFLLGLSAGATIVILEDRAAVFDEHPDLRLAAVIIALLAIVSGVAVMRQGRRRAGHGIGRGEGLWLVVPVLMTLLLADITYGTLEDQRRSPARAMALFARRAAGRPLASLDRKPTVLFYLGRRNVETPPDAAAASAWLANNPGGYLVVSTDSGARPPRSLAARPVKECWSSPDGRRAWSLLGGADAR